MEPATAPAPDENKVAIPLQAWLSLMNTFNCDDPEGGKCELGFAQIQALYTAALLARNDTHKDIWESDGSIYVRTQKDGGDTVEEVVMGRKATLVAAHLLRNGGGSTFELSRYFGGTNPVNGVRKAIYEINQTLNRYGFFAEVAKKGIYRIVKAKSSKNIL